MGVGGNLSRDSDRGDEQTRNLRLGIELGLTLLDTAEVYGAGHSEELVGAAVRGLRDKVFISSKVSPEHLGRRDLTAACEHSLRRLKVDCIDLYQIHWPNPQIPIAETIGAMNRLREAGKIRFLGVSNFSLGQLQEAQGVSDYPISALQVEYNLFDRGIENDLLPYCIEQGIAVIAYSPLDQGRDQLSATQRATLQTIAERNGKSCEQVVLNWIISHQGVAAIPKASQPEHIRANAAAADFDLAPAEIALIGSSFRSEPITVPVDRIKVVLDGQGNRAAYQTIEEARENRLGFCPSPQDLAREIARLAESIKPVRLRRSRDSSGRYEYDLVEGRIRYWAWVLAHDGRLPVPALLIEKDK
jgi:diketogulonate reductase-like aldo/keto reductase